MPAFLGGQTKVYQAYGRKRNTHTTNVRRVSPLDWDAESTSGSGSTNNIKQQQQTASSTDSETDYDEPPQPIKPAKASIAVKRKDALSAIRSKRAAGVDKENARSTTTASAQAKAKASLAPSPAPLKPSSKAEEKGKGKVVLKGDASPTPTALKSATVSVASKAAPLTAKRPTHPGRFLGVFIDPPRRHAPPPATAKAKAVPVPVISIDSDDDESDKAAPLETELSDKFGDLELSDDDDDDDEADVSDVGPDKTRQSGSSSEPKLVTYASRRGRRVAAAAVETSSEDESSALEVSAPVRKPLAQPQTRTRANSRSTASIPHITLPTTPPRRATATRQSKPTATATASSTLAFPSLLKPLLRITSAGSPPKAAFDFSSFVVSPPVPLASSSAQSRWRKVGEASFSEVFSVPSASAESALVVKIIPVSPYPAGKAPAAKKNDAELPLMSDWQAVEREVALSSLLGGDDAAVEGFVKFKGAFLVQGAYPSELLGAWDDFKKAQSPPCDDQIRPDVLPKEQVYILIVLEHGGRDLESFKIRTWLEAASVLWQVAQVCARAEDAVQFEHRDLHWGNVLVNSREKQSLSARMEALTVTPRKGASAGAEPLSIASLEASRSGVEVTLIDFTLSRATDPKEGALWDEFEDELIFEGEGDSQFDVYRAMRDHVKEDWEGYHPLTNVMWIHHLATKLIKHKKLKPPMLTPTRLANSILSASPMTAASPIRRGVAKRGVKSSAGAKATPANSAIELQAWKLLQEVAAKLEESVKLEGKAKPGRPKKGSKKAGLGLKSAREVCSWWEARANGDE